MTSATDHRSVCAGCPWQGPWTSELEERFSRTQVPHPSEYGTQHAKGTGHAVTSEKRPHPGAALPPDNLGNSA